MAPVAEENRRAAAEVDERVRPVIEDIKAAGITSLGGIAAELNRRGILTARGRAWHPSSVRLLLFR